MLEDTHTSCHLKWFKALVRSPSVFIKINLMYWFGLLRVVQTISVRVLFLLLVREGIGEHIILSRLIV